MTTPDIDHLFEIIPKSRKFIGGYISNIPIFVVPCPREGFLVSMDDIKITASGARRLSLALLAAADAAEAAEAAGARIK
jgi:hypothetical protein